MNNRLDFNNSVEKHCETLTKDDALLVLSHNKKNGDCFTVLAGDWEILSSLFSDKKCLESDNVQYQNTRNMILNTAYNICLHDEKARKKIIKALTK